MYSLTSEPFKLDRDVEAIAVPTGETIELPAGVVGYIDFSGNLDTAIAIRTMVITHEENGPNRASVQAGAGVVYDSEPELEHNECYHKASALLAAVPAAERLTAARRAQTNSSEPEAS